jgi:hypothetical protein
MDGEARRWSPERVVVVAALAFGLAAGTYGVANAASGSGSGQTRPQPRPRALSGREARSGAMRLRWPVMR